MDHVGAAGQGRIEYAAEYQAAVMAHVVGQGAGLGQYRANLCQWLPAQFERLVEDDDADVRVAAHQIIEPGNIDQQAARVDRQMEYFDAHLARQLFQREVPAVAMGEVDETFAWLAGRQHQRLFGGRPAIGPPVECLCPEHAPGQPAQVVGDLVHLPWFREVPLAHGYREGEGAVVERPGGAAGGEAYQFARVVLVGGQAEGVLTVLVVLVEGLGQPLDERAGVVLVLVHVQRTPVCENTSGVTASSVWRGPPMTSYSIWQDCSMMAW
jgi:hypothetical protein